MKKVSLLVLLSILISSSTILAQSIYSIDDEIHLWGSISIENLKTKPYSQWYYESQKEYTPKMQKELFSNLQDVNVKIFLGTWCGDTKNYLPKFIETWQSAGLPSENLELIALRNGEKYKQGPNQEERPYNIHRVPTFVFERDGIEIGRIVEHPVTDLETDIAQISAGLPSKPSYPGVSKLQVLFEEHSLDTLQNRIDKIARTIQNDVSYVGELTTYAKKLQSDGEIEKANYVYTLNNMLYRYHPYSFYRLAAFKFKCDEIETAKEYFEKCQSIKNDYLDTTAYLEKIATIEGGEKRQ